MRVDAVTHVLRVHRPAVITGRPAAIFGVHGGLRGLVLSGDAGMCDMGTTVRCTILLQFRGRRVTIMHVRHQRLDGEEAEAQHEEERGEATEHRNRTRKSARRHAPGTAKYTDEGWREQA